MSADVRHCAASYVSCGNMPLNERGDGVGVAAVLHSCSEGGFAGQHPFLFSVLSLIIVVLVL